MIAEAGLGYADVTLIVREERGKALRVFDGTREFFLPKSQIGERRVQREGTLFEPELGEGETLEEIEIREWLAIKEGLA